jgi:hypothetical protein
MQALMPSQSRLVCILWTSKVKLNASKNFEQKSDTLNSITWLRIMILPFSVNLQLHISKRKSPQSMFEETKILELIIIPALFWDQSGSLCF